MNRSDIDDYLSDERASSLSLQHASEEAYDDRSVIPESVHQRPTYADNDICPACGDPLPLDRQCTCTGDPDLDVRVGLRELK